MNKQTRNKVKAFLIMLGVDVVSTFLILLFLGVGTDLIFTRQSLVIIVLVNVITIFILNKFKLIEDGK